MVVLASSEQPAHPQAGASRGEDVGVASLLLSRLPAPVVRGVDWDALVAASRSASAGGGGAERDAPTADGIMARYALRHHPSVASVLERIWETALSAQAEADTAVGLAPAAFATFHGLLSRALNPRVDEQSAAVIAECEWLLACGAPSARMPSAAFCEWMYDVLEGWRAVPSAESVVALAEELLETVCHVQPAGHAPALRHAHDVEWTGLLRFRDATAPPTSLNWAQVTARPAPRARHRAPSTARPAPRAAPVSPATRRRLAPAAPPPRPRLASTARRLARAPVLVGAPTGAGGFGVAFVAATDQGAVASARRRPHTAAAAAAEPSLAAVGRHRRLGIVKRPGQWQPRP